jgi:hypothetical protein
MFASIKNIIRNSLFYDLIRPMLQEKQFQEWIKSGRPAPAPSMQTQRVVKEYAIKFSTKTLVETGTFRGDMVNAQKDMFSRIYSVELDERLAKKAQKRFSGFKHIKIFQGNSADMLPGIIKQASEPYLFWLDAHFSGGVTARGDVDTPIIQELRCILDNRTADDVILIDDARHFVGLNDYPTIQELRDFILKNRPDWVFEIKDDIIRTHRNI